MAAVGKRIVVGFDASPASQRALGRAAELAGYGSRVTVIGLGSADAPPTNGRGLVADARAELARLRLRADVVESSEPALDALLGAAAGLAADVLVVGERPDGSLASRLLGEAPCDVLVVR